MTQTRLDDLRQRFPELGFAIYAIEPRSAITLEIFTPDGQTYSFTAPTEQQAIDKAFPEEEIGTKGDIFE